MHSIRLWTSQPAARWWWLSPLHSDYWSFLASFLELQNQQSTLTSELLSWDALKVNELLKAEDWQSLTEEANKSNIPIMPVSNFSSCLQHITTCACFSYANFWVSEMKSINSGLDGLNFNPSSPLPSWVGNVTSLVLGLLICSEKVIIVTTVFCRV